MIIYASTSKAISGFKVAVISLAIEDFGSNSKEAMEEEDNFADLDSENKSWLSM